MFYTSVQHRHRFKAVTVFQPMLQTRAGQIRPGNSTLRARYWNPAYEWSVSKTWRKWFLLSKLNRMPNAVVHSQISDEEFFFLMTTTTMMMMAYKMKLVLLPVSSSLQNCVMLLLLLLLMMMIKYCWVPQLLPQKHLYLQFLPQEYSKFKSRHPPSYLNFPSQKYPNQPQCKNS